MMTHIIAKSLILFGITFSSSAALAWGNANFSESGLYHVPNCPGVYVIYRGSQPFYVGRSRNSIADRLKRHLNGSGSRKVAEAVASGATMSVSYECGDSPEQMEAILIKEFGTNGLGNLRRESDPADWNN